MPKCSSYRKTQRKSKSSKKVGGKSPAKKSVKKSVKRVIKTITSSNSGIIGKNITKQKENLRTGKTTYHKDITVEPKEEEDLFSSFGKMKF